MRSSAALADSSVDGFTRPSLIRRICNAVLSRGGAHSGTGASTGTVGFLGMQQKVACPHRLRYLTPINLVGCDGQRPAPSCIAVDDWSSRPFASRPGPQEVQTLLLAEDPSERRVLSQDLASLSLVNSRSKGCIHTEIDQLLPGNEIRQGGQIPLLVSAIQCLLNTVEQCRVTPDLLHHQAVQRQAFPIEFGWTKHSMNLPRSKVHPGRCRPSSAT